MKLYHYTLIKMAKIKNHWQNQLLVIMRNWIKHSAGGNIKCYSGKHLALSYKSKHVVNIKCNYYTLIIYPREIKMCVHTKPVDKWSLWCYL